MSEFASHNSFYIGVYVKTADNIIIKEIVRQLLYINTVDK